MTYEEALNKLDETVIGDLELKVTLSEALKKQITRKAEKDIDIIWGTPKEMPVCPVCDYFLTPTYFIGEGEKVTYCENCGQAIDWSE